MENWQSFIEAFDEVQIFTGLSAQSSLSFLVVLLVSLCFGFAISLLYNLYFLDNEPQDGSLSRSLVLLTPALTSIFWMIQFSVPISIGLIGALSFVRFRTPVKRSEDVTFVVIALGVSISCATANFLVAFVLISVFLAFAYLRRKIKYLNVTQSKFAIITYNTSKTSSMSEIKKIIASSTVKRFDIVSSRTYDGITSFVINIPDLKSNSYEEINQSLSAFDEKSHISVFYPNDRLGS